MFTVGMIGTSSIAHEFAKALVLSNKFQVKAIYSRTYSQAEQFGQPYGADLFYDQLEDMLMTPEIEVVYIASPNSLHFEQTMEALNHGKHVIVEKPAFSNTKEWEAAFLLAEEKGLFLFEAARHLHDPNFKKVQAEIQQLPMIDGAILQFGKYSSRYDAVLQGEEPNIFSPHFSGGALMDLGVYSLYAALGWFGEPESGQYFYKPVATGVDGAGTVVLRYSTFDVILHVSKISNLLSKSEIHSGQFTLLLDGVSNTTKVEVHDGRTGEKSERALPVSEHFMLDEVNAFARVLSEPTETKEYEEWKEQSRTVHQWLEKLRKEAGIFFDADSNE